MKAFRGIVPLLWMLTCVGVSGAYRYEATLLDGYATALNARDQVVGAYHDAAGISHPVLWENGVRKELNRFPGVKEGELSPGSAEGINDSGQVIGSKWNGERWVGWVLNHDGVIYFDMPDRSFAPIGINESGAIVNAWASFTPEVKFFDFSPGPSVDAKKVVGINNEGVVIGLGYATINLPLDIAYTFIFSASGDAKPSAIVTNLWPVALDERGNIGGSGTFKYVRHWPAFHEFGETRMLAAYGFGQVSAMNNKGQMVGSNSSPRGTVCYWENGIAVELDSLVANSEMFPTNSLSASVSAVAINDSGTIFIRDGRSRSYLLRPTEEIEVPELTLSLPADGAVATDEIMLAWKLRNSTNFTALRALTFPVQTVRSVGGYHWQMAATIHPLSVELSEGTLTAVAAGPNGLMFELVDKEGRIWLTPPRFVTVSRPAAIVAARDRFTGVFEMVLDAQPEAIYAVEHSPDLVNWVTVTNYSETAPRVYTLPSATNEKGFFRFRKVAEEGGPSAQTPLLEPPVPGYRDLLRLTDKASGTVRRFGMFSGGGYAYLNSVGRIVNYQIRGEGPRVRFWGRIEGEDKIMRPFWVELDYDHPFDALNGRYIGYYKGEFAMPNAVEKSSGDFEFYWR